MLPIVLMTTPLSSPALVTKEVVLAKCDYFLELQLWPTRTTIDPVNWLNNFTDQEKPYAICLLNSFQYFSEDLTDQLFKSAFQGLSLTVCDPAESFVVAQTKWANFLKRVLVAYAEGENPNPTDSGFIFARKARQLIGIEETNIQMNVAILEALLNGRTQLPVVFVDDFVGSGDQFATTWHRRRELPGLKIRVSFQDVAAQGKGIFYYCPLVATERGVARITSDCPDVKLRPVHVVTDRDSVLSTNSHIWPANLRADALQVIEQVSARAGISNWKGYADLGLALAFKHCVPDATLPLFYWEERGWRPLVKRS